MKFVREQHYPGKPRGKKGQWNNATAPHRQMDVILSMHYGDAQLQNDPLKLKATQGTEFVDKSRKCGRSNLFENLEWVASSHNLTTSGICHFWEQHTQVPWSSFLEQPVTPQPGLLSGFPWDSSVPHWFQEGEGPFLVSQTEKTCKVLRSLQLRKGW